MTRKQLLNSCSYGQDLRRCALHEPRHLMIRPIPTADLHETLSRPYVVALRPRCHVAVQQCIRECLISRKKLGRQLGAESADISLDASTRMMSDQAHHLIVYALTAKKARSIKRVEARLYQLGSIADVMKPSRRHKIIR